MAPIVARLGSCYEGAVTSAKKPPRDTVVLTNAQVRELLAEGRLVRAELEKRIAKMHQVSLEARLTPAR
jgi:hypothetical protein